VALPVKTRRRINTEHHASIGTPILSIPSPLEAGQVRMEVLDATGLVERLRWEDNEYWLHLEAEGPFEKYPGKFRDVTNCMHQDTDIVQRSSMRGECRKSWVSMKG
jgi:hypothetical protein